jgi:hypothetical protein
MALLKDTLALGKFKFVYENPWISSQNYKMDLCSRQKGINKANLLNKVILEKSSFHFVEKMKNLYLVLLC